MRRDRSGTYGYRRHCIFLLVVGPPRRLAASRSAVRSFFVFRITFMPSWVRTPEKRPRGDSHGIWGGGASHSPTYPPHQQLAGGRAIVVSVPQGTRGIIEHVDASAGAVNGAHDVLAEPHWDPEEGQRSAPKGIINKEDYCCCIYIGCTFR